MHLLKKMPVLSPLNKTSAQSIISNLQNKKTNTTFGKVKRLMSTSTEESKITKDQKPRQQLLLDGRDADAPSQNKKLVAVTRCAIKFSNEEDLQKCVEALRESDEALRKRPNEKKCGDGI